VQEAFLETGAVQCGFCTPGLLVAAHDLLRRDPDPGDQDVREALAGNLCRCTGYEAILEAVRLAAARMHGTPEQPTGRQGSGAPS
jgi:carbon-monoxide dehydrogenase small subunit